MRRLTSFAVRALIVVTLAAAGPLVTGLTTPAHAAFGDGVATITADRTGAACAGDPDHGSVGTGIAFDGSQLLLSCWYDYNIVAVSPADGSQIAIYPISGMVGQPGAMAWDSGRNKLWICDGYSDVGLIDLGSLTYTKAFTSGGCIDGLGYDPSDDTIWASGDAAGSNEHFTLDGTLLNSYNNSGLLGSCGNSGIAVASGGLYLANNGCSEIYFANKSFTSSVRLTTFSRRIEDLECDDVTFAASGKTVLWSVDAYDNILNAWEIPAGSCTVGGGTAQLSLNPAVGSDPVNTNHNATATLLDGTLTPVSGGDVHFQVSGANSGSGNGTTDVNGHAAFSYTGTNEGDDTITVCQDNSPSNNACDPGELTASALQHWTGGGGPLGECGDAGTDRVSIGDGSVLEGHSGAARKIKIPVTISNASASEVDVQYVIHTGSATAPDDIASPVEVAKTLKFKPSSKTGLTSTTKFISVKVNPDSALEGQEEFTVKLSNPTGGYSVGRSVGNGIIIDDDEGGPGQHVGITRGALCEGDSSPKGNKLTLSVALADPAAGQQTATVTVSDISTTAGSDYKAIPKPKKVTFKDGQVQKFVTITTYADFDLEADEMLQASITTATLDVDADGTNAIATTLNDD